MVDTTIVSIFLRKYFPNLKKQFDNPMVTPLINTFIQQSLLGMYTTFLSEETILLIWDFLFLEGSTVLIKVAIALFCIKQKDIIKSKDDIVELKAILNERMKDIGPDSLTLVHALAIKQFEFNHDFLERKRERIGISVSELLEKSSLETTRNKVQIKGEDKLKRQLSKSCSTTWPYCLNDFYFENVTNITKFIVFDQQGEKKIIRDYFFENSAMKEKENNKEVWEMELKKGEEFDIMVERRPHYCSDVIKEIKKERDSNVKEEKEEKGVNDNKEKMEDMMGKVWNAEGFLQQSTLMMHNFKPEEYKEISSEEGN